MHLEATLIAARQWRRSRIAHPSTPNSQWRPSWASAPPMTAALHGFEAPAGRWGLGRRSGARRGEQCWRWVRSEPRG